MSLIVFPECKSCNKNFIGTSTVLCGACSEQEISPLKEKVKELEKENAHLRKVNGIKLKKTTIKQSLVHANEALEKEREKVKELEAAAKTYSQEWDACRKKASDLAEKIEHREAQIALLRAGLEEFGICGFNCSSRESNGEFKDPPVACDCGFKRALTSDGSELLEAVRDITEAVEELLEPMPHLLHGVFGENAHADISERIENAEKSLSRLRGLV